MTEEPVFGTQAWVKHRWKEQARATAWVLRNHLYMTVTGSVAFGLDAAGWMEPSGFGVAYGIGWGLMAMFVAQDISLGIIEVAVRGNEGEADE